MLKATTVIGKAPADHQTPAELFQRYCKKAEIIHRFAENLAQTWGVFHGINETGKKLAVEGDAAMALSTILFDQLQVMVIRLCALCSSGTRKEDASIGDLVDGLSDKRFQQFLVEREQKWRDAVGFRAGLPTGEIPKFI